MTSNSTLTRGNFWIITMNSTIAFLLAYTLVFYTNHMMTIIGAGLFAYDLSFDYNIIYYHIESYEWTADAVRMIFSIGPLLVLIIGIAAISVYSKTSEDLARIKILFLWIAIIAFNYFFGGLLIGNIFKKGIGHVFSWMYLNDTEKLVIAMVGLFSIVLIALLMAKSFAMSVNSYVNKLNEDNFPFLVTAQIILPFIFGTILTIAYQFPRILFQERYSWISLGVMLAIIIGRISQFNVIYFDEEERKISLAWLPILITILAVATLRLVLNKEYLIIW